jgi:alkanesulfonate monooxygenase SsuD/methylene tetrahydromethanopterin reductase-like flavin-dependent oxidoreductase (luciferase family)
VISHLESPTLADARALAQAAEVAGADWVGFPDAFWWRDTWLLCAAAAGATERIAVGPMVTNPFLRHPFHTVSALATLQEAAGPRVRLGIAAGGSEVSAAAGVPRAGAPARIEALARLVRSVAHGEPLDLASGRRLDVPLGSVTITVAGRGDGVLRAAGRTADEALLWAVPMSDLDRSAAVIRAGEARRRAPGALSLVWAPLVIHGDDDRVRARAIATYGVLNAVPVLRERWGVDDALAAEIRAALVAGGPASAAYLVPAHVVDDVADPDPDPARHGAVAARIGADAVAVPAHDLTTVAERVAWARAVLDAASR